MARQFEQPIEKLIQQGDYLRWIYRLAAARVREPGLRSVLKEEAASLDHLLQALLASVPMGKPLSARRRPASAWWVTHIGGQSDAQWIRRLQRCEARFLRHYERSVSISSPPLQAVLRPQLPRLRAINMDMEGLGQPMP